MIRQTGFVPHTNIHTAHFLTFGLRPLVNPRNRTETLLVRRRECRTSLLLVESVSCELSTVRVHPPRTSFAHISIQHGLGYSTDLDAKDHSRGIISQVQYFSLYWRGAKRRLYGTCLVLIKERRRSRGANSTIY